MVEDISKNPISDVLKTNINPYKNCINKMSSMASLGKVLKTNPVKIQGAAVRTLQISNNWKRISKIGIGSQICNTAFKDSMHRINALTNQLQQALSKVRTPIIFPNSYYESLASVGKAIKETFENPDSTFNYSVYSEKLKTYYWAYPYKMPTETLKIYLEESSSDEEFDEKTVAYFEGENEDNMFKDILFMLDNKYNEVFKQIIAAYNSELYILVSLACTSIIDGILSNLYKDTCKNVNANLIQCIFDDTDVCGHLPFAKEFLLIIMLSNNIKTLFETIQFDQDIEIESSKKTRRHTMMHGRMYSNSKAGALMVINTLFCILENRKFFDCFEHSIDKKNGKLYICSEQKINILNRLSKIYEIV